MQRSAPPTPGRLVGLVQGVYYLASGIWPLVSIRTFERVTGPKADDWLVKTVGALAAVIGAVLVVRSVAREAPPDPVLGAAAAAAFAAVDVNYVARRRISPIYLADAIAELALIAGWAAARARRSE
jgi:4-amino-4-deoxy-L-arabinose transferase-like glycosyltransferase